MSINIPIRGMHCKSCEILIEKHLSKLPEVREVRVNYQDGFARILCKGVAVPSSDAIRRAVVDAGYEVGKNENLPWISKDLLDYTHLIWAAAILGVLYYAAVTFGLFNLDVDTSNMGVIVVLLVGLVAGVSTCMALVGGLVLALSARHAESHPEATTLQNFRPHLYFNVGRILGYGLLGGIIGWLGAAITPSAGALGVMSFLVGLVMIFLGLKLIEIFPFLKNKSLALPKSISKALGLHKENREYSHRGALLTGALTFFLPCGFTQAMQLYAVSTGSFWQGALVMSVFALGTAPGLLGIGYLSSVFKGSKARLFFMVAGLAVIFLGAYNISNSLTLLGTTSGASDSKPVEVVTEVTPVGDVQEVRMAVDSGGYSPNTFTVKKGVPVRWVIDAKSVYTCAAFLIMPKMDISRALQSGENVITFTPTESGTIPFSCSMGMYRGKFIVQ